MRFSRRMFFVFFLSAFPALAFASADVPVAPAAEADISGTLTNVATTVQQSQDQGTRQRMTATVLTGALGHAGAEIMAGRAQQRADDDWARRIDRLGQTFRCGLDGHPRVGPGESGHTPMEPQEVVRLRAEYIALATRTRETKRQLGLPPGIEAREIVDMGAAYDAHAATDLDFSGGFSTAAGRSDSGAGTARARQGMNVALAGVAAAALMNAPAAVRGATGGGGTTGSTHSPAVQAAINNDPQVQTARQEKAEAKAEGDKEFGQQSAEEQAAATDAITCRLCSRGMRTGPECAGC